MNVHVDVESRSLQYKVSIIHQCHYQISIATAPLPPSQVSNKQHQTKSMPKVSRTQKFRAKAASASPVSRKPVVSSQEETNNNIDDGHSNKSNIGEDARTNQNTALSRGQKKRQAKRDQYLKREKMILSTLKLQKMEEQKKRIDGLDAIKEALTQTIRENQERKELEKQQQAEDAPAKTNKSKKNIAQKEISHLNLVLQHPSFKSNPFATMQEHLRNTLSQQAKEQGEAAKKERIEEERKDKEKKEAKKERIRNAKYEKGRKPRRRYN